MIIALSEDNNKVIMHGSSTMDIARAMALDGDTMAAACIANGLIEARKIKRDTDAANRMKELMEALARK